MKVDAIVNPTDYRMSGAGSIDKRVHNLGGSALAEECAQFKHCMAGDALATLAYNTLAQYIIHTVGPIWGKSNNPNAILSNCYRNSLHLAEKLKIKSIAFPLIASGTFGVPKDLALKIAITEINDYLIYHPKLNVYLVIYSQESYVISRRLTEDIIDNIKNKELNIERNRNYQALDEEYKEINLTTEEIGSSKMSCMVLERLHNGPYKSMSNESICIKSSTIESKSISSKKNKVDVDDPNFMLRFKNFNDIAKAKISTFSDYFFKVLSKYDFKNSDIYRAAGITKMVFSNILTKDVISKNTALALCLALPFSLEEAKEFLMYAGYAFSPLNKLDLAVFTILSKNRKNTNLSLVSLYNHDIYIAANVQL